MLNFTESTRLRPQVESVRYTRVRVEVTQGLDRSKVVEAAGTTLRIGTADTADLRLGDDTVSREHCEIELHEAGFRIRDAQSTNGIFLNGVRVYDIESACPLELALGDTVLTITPLAAAETRERSQVGRFGDLLGESPKMRELFAVLARIAPTDLSVLIEGETGTGKELVANSIHHASARADGPFIVFDCSTISSNLIESDLFGHERGAFTGATATRAGALEDADGGTLFLDEIGELPLELQQKLLRCLQSGEFRRVGGRKLSTTDVRIVAATHRDLRHEIEAGRFREDLFYRLEGVTVQVPPLRERLEDLPLLVDHFLRQSKPKESLTSLPRGALQMFRAHRWPGNVRELRNVVRRLQVLPDWSLELVERAPSQVAEIGPTAPEPTRACPRALSQLEARVVPRLRSWRGCDAAYERSDWLGLEEARRETNEAFELDYLSVLKAQSGGIKARAAHWAGVSRQAIQKLVRKHDLNWRDSDSEA